MQTDYDDDHESLNIGNCVHEFLNETFHSGLTKDLLLKISKSSYEKALDAKIDEFFKTAKTGKMYLLRKLLKIKLNEFRETELQRNFKRVLETEQDYSSAIDVNGVKYNLVSRMDRIDENEDGTISIIDYKTGGADTLADRGFIYDETLFSREVVANNIKSFQLIIYKYLYEQKYPNKTVSQVMLYSLKDSTIIPLIKDKNKEKISFDMLIKHLKFILADINNDEPFRRELYDDVECEKCPYFFLCR